jgi:hypothetical protein
MEIFEESNIKKHLECPVCHSREVHQISQPGGGYQCKMCSRTFPNPDETLGKEHDYDFPSPEDHDLQ